MKTRNTFIVGLVFVIYLTLQSCSQPHGNSTGSEFMPDMAHSVAYEANYYSYYYNNTWGSEEEYYEYAKPRLPVKGTVPRGGSNEGTAQKSVPYYYGSSEEERTRATNEIIKNPLLITDAGLASGKQNYDIYCGICHGAKADGLGHLARDGSPYPVQPAILNSDEFKAASNGRYYHAIMHGKNLMGNYKDKLNYEERWNVIHYIRSLHAKEAGLAYNQFENTLNSIDEPAGEIAMVKEVEQHDGHHDDGHHGDEHHGDEHHEGEHHDANGHEEHGHKGDHHEDDHHDSDHH